LLELHSALPGDSETATVLQTSHRTAETISASQQAVIDTVLIGVQKLLKISELATNHQLDDEELGCKIDKGGYRGHAATATSISTAIDMPKVVQVTCAYLNIISTSTFIDSQASAVQVAAFLSRYTEMCKYFVQEQLLEQLAVSRLLMTLAKLTDTLSQEGFCQPVKEPENDGQAMEADKTGVEGSGMGQGSGDKDVGDEIEAEEQVEGLESEKKEDDNDDLSNDPDGVEMTNDFDGEMQDNPEGSEKGQDSGEEDDDEPDDAVGDVDPLGENTIDEKLWAGEEGEQKPDVDKGGQLDEAKQANDISSKTDQTTQEQQQDSHDDVNDAQPADAEMDEARADTPQSPEQGVTNLPEESDILQDEESKPEQTEKAEDELDSGELPDDMEVDDGHFDNAASPQQDDVTEEGDAIMDDVSAEHTPDMDGPDSEEAEQQQGEDRQHENQQADAAESSAGNLPSQDDAAQAGQGESASLHATAQSESKEADAGLNSDPRQTTTEGQGNPEIDQNNTAAPSQSSSSAPRNLASDKTLDVNDVSATPSSEYKQASEKQLGDALQDWKKQLQAIADEAVQIAEEQAADQPSSSAAHTKEGEAFDRQIMGAATEREALPSSQVSALGNEPDPLDDEDVNMQDENLRPTARAINLHQSSADLFHQPDDSIADQVKPAQQPFVESQGIPDVDRVPVQNGVTSSETKEEREEDAVVPILDDVLSWHDKDNQILDPEEVWRHYLSITRDSSQILTEQLRLILEPTLANRLKGDYKTGKRLNMRRIIQYIASDYSKDKIWLRRTKPSDRQYQIMLAVDNSKSMADSSSIHLAFQTLSMVVAALQKLEAGQVSIARFGSGVDILHHFADGPITERAGSRIVNGFTFSERNTNVKQLLQETLSEFTRARTALPGNSTAELWQLQIIISDGMVQSQEELRALLRQAISKKIFVVFIVLDSLDKKTTGGGQTDRANPGSSITTMQRVVYAQNSAGQMEIQMQPYLDTFPFDYFVILRDTKDLPTVLSKTLRQFFELVSQVQ